jgi:glyoxylase-like metal-dependent hydrolase (beta-lactamase superfamily II)
MVEAQATRHPSVLRHAGASLQVRRMLLGEMKNFVYLLKDTATCRAAVIDPAWDVSAILEQAGDVEVTDILVSHWHDDHVNGVEEMIARTGARVHLLDTEAAFWHVDLPTLVRHADGDVIELGSTPIRIVHTPGHSPGSACYAADDALFTGDTLFMYGCGRCDLEGSDIEAMYHSLQRLKNEFDPGTRIHPGHDYAEVPSSSLDEQLRRNPFLHPDTVESFVAFRTEHNNHRHPPYRPVERGAPAW